MSEESGQRLAAPGLRGLLHCEGLQCVLRSVSLGGRRRPVLGRAAAVARLGDAKALQPQAEAVVGEQLAQVMQRASEVPEALVAELLQLLAEAVEAADRCGGALAEEKNPAEEAELAVHLISYHIRCTRSMKSDI